MKDLQADIYNALFEAGHPGLTSAELAQRFRAQADRMDVSKALHELREAGRIHVHTHQAQKRYMAGHAVRKAEPSGVQASSTEGTDPPPAAPQKTPAKAAKPTPINQPSKQLAPTLVDALEQQANTARDLLEQYLDSLNDPVLQALINSCNELDAAAKAARDKAA